MATFPVMLIILGNTSFRALQINNDGLEKERERKIKYQYMVTIRTNKDFSGKHLLFLIPIIKPKLKQQLTKLQMLFVLEGEFWSPLSKIYQLE